MGKNKRTLESGRESSATTNHILTKSSPKHNNSTNRRFTNADNPQRRMKALLYILLDKLEPQLILQIHGGKSTSYNKYISMKSTEGATR